MTREEAKKELISTGEYICGCFIDLINKIYNDFEQERREQSRIRSESLSLYKSKENERMEEFINRKYAPIIHQYKTAHKNLVNENRKLRKEEG